MITERYDFVVVGGGFYGCCLALFARSVSERVLLIEQEPRLMERGSRVNQARVHTGFHYPRSFVTALRSLSLHARFAADFPEAIDQTFSMLYAVARRKSKVSPQRFFRMYRSMNAPIEPADARMSALFDSDRIAGVFKCFETAFDYRALRDGLKARLEAAGVTCLLGQGVDCFEMSAEDVRVVLSGGGAVRGGHIINATYAQINAALQASGLEALPLKHEFAEIALVVPPPELRGLAVTVMDGPFFSFMPFPAEERYSLTHVRYTPHFTWTDRPGGPAAYSLAKTLPQHSKWRHMTADARRYLPVMGAVQYDRSLFDVKTVLTKNERDDGRPILFHRHRDAPRVISIMGGKIDNIYDLFTVFRAASPHWAQADTRYLFS
ncbi:MAG: FAD-binding oxidoreductase [Pseudomonadota bacterium]